MQFLSPIRLHIFGASGTGVTTLGLALSERLTIPYFDCDEYFWHKTEPPFTVKRAPEERNAMIRADLDRQDNWILGGSSVSWGENVFPPFTQIVFLRLPPEIRMARLKVREHQRYGDIIYTDPQRNKAYEAFMAWAADYDKGNGTANRNIAIHEQWMQRQTAPILQIREDLTTAERMDRIIPFISNSA